MDPQQPTQTPNEPQESVTPTPAEFNTFEPTQAPITPPVVSPVTEPVPPTVADTLPPALTTDAPTQPVVPLAPSTPVDPGTPTELQPTSPVDVSPAEPPTSSQAPAAVPINPGKTMGIVSFILALIGLGPIGLVLGIIARMKSKKAGMKNGFALAGIIIGALSTVALIGVIALTTTFLATHSKDITTTVTTN